VQQGGEACEQAAVVATNIKDALDRFANFCLNVPEQA
jgi:hypothetical protein